MATNQIKRGRDSDEYTPERIAELKRCKSDPIYFLKNYVVIKHPTRGPVPFKLFPFQERFISAIHENKNTIALFPRQCGKCCFYTTLLDTIERPTGLKRAILYVFDNKTYKMLFK
jgi:hypothetical protein